MTAIAFPIGWPRRGAKVALAGSVVFAGVALLIGCRGTSTRQQDVRPTAEWMRGLESGWALHSPGKAYSIRTASDVRRDGEDSLRFELRGGEQWVNKRGRPTYRAEVDTEQLSPAGAVKWYSFSVYFPADFPIEENRLAFAQWKEEESPQSGGLSPSLAFRFVSGKLSITLRHDDGKPITDADAVPAERLFRTADFARGRWHDFVVQAKWSYREDGLVNAWWNGKQVVSYRGPVGYDPGLAQNLGPQFQFGLYRDATDATYVAYFSRVRMGDTPQAVGFAGPTTAPAGGEAEKGT